MLATKTVVKEGSVRVDLVGGTLDLPPIHLIIKDVITLNLATSLKAKVIIVPTDKDYVEIVSRDYNSVEVFNHHEFTEDNLSNDHFGPLTFVAQILSLFSLHRGVKLELSSGAPAGSGLGGSSAMGVTIFSAIAEFLSETEEIDLPRLDVVRKVRDIEGRMLNSGIPGYQDYYPALYGGILALKPTPGTILVEQLFTPSLKKFLESHISLVYSGISRLSGINNWEVYKAFFDKNQKVVDGLTDIAQISQEAYQAIKCGKYDLLLKKISEEGKEREALFPNIVSSEIKSMFFEIQKHRPHVGLKVCGAGGGGCFILTHQKDDRNVIAELVQKYQMHLLDFKVESPL